MGRNAIRRTRKQERRRNRKQKRNTVAAGMAALATVAAVGAGQMISPEQAAAVTIPGVGEIDDPAGQLGEIIAGIANNEATQEALTALRIELCATGGTSGGADCSKSTGTGVAVILPTRIELVPRVDDGDDTDVLYNGTQDYLNNPPTEPVREDFPDGVTGDAAFAAAYAQYLIDLGVQQTAVAGAGAIGIGVPVPDAPVTEGSAKVIGSGFQFALASGGGKATAISYLPVSLATAGASDGRTAISFAIVGMANAWTTSEIPVTVLGSSEILGVELPSIPAIQQVSCYGGITGAYAEGVGACANVAGTFDFRLDLLKDSPEVQFGLTDPSAILFDPAGVFGQVITQILNGQPISLSKDFARLSAGGDYDLLSGNFVRFTSDYGTQEPIVINWLGQELTLNPMVTVNGQERPNHLGAPVLVLNTLDTGEIVPVIGVPEIEFPFGIPTAGPYVIPDTTSSTLTTTTPAAPAPEPLPETDETPMLLRAGALEDPTPVSTPETEPIVTPTALDEPASSSNSVGPVADYIGKHRTPEGGSDIVGDYVGKHRSDSTDDEGTAEQSSETTSSSPETSSPERSSEESSSDEAASEKSESGESSDGSNETGGSEGGGSEGAGSSTGESGSTTGSGGFSGSTGD
ncbi:hypothetical protein GORHZ_186_00010 [Gordonia rhizosphera NBRC 16068]|uniref:Uncharacterized protein n=1 Tax=Gordonia rhizosphera NBRC 16068 TaxID=1108045 RepID=K6WFT2_9ACTN|nr:hypothetical protein GORHZ_186_00010 [Gordonia rhizosphera NBRC 16068]